METKNEKFIRLRDARMPNIKQALKTLGNLASANYDYSEAEARALIADVEAEVEVLKGKFYLTDAVLPSPPPLELPEDTNDLVIQNTTPEETQHLIRVGSRINAAIEAITDERVEDAKDILYGLMIS